MGRTRVIYTDSTTAECGTVLKMFNFDEDVRMGCFVHMDQQAVKAYLVWGRAAYYPEIQKRLTFSPRVQIHFKAGNQVDSLDSFAQETAVALKNLDPNSRIQIFNADTGEEITG